MADKQHETGSKLEQYELDGLPLHQPLSTPPLASPSSSSASALDAHSNDNQTFTSWDCRRAPFTDPSCGSGASSFDQTNICRGHNICYDTQRHRLLVFNGHSNGNSRSTMPYPPPYYRPEGSSLFAISVASSIEEYTNGSEGHLSVRWVSTPTILWEGWSPLKSGARHYQHLIEAIGGLFLLAWDYDRLRLASQQIELVLVDRGPVDHYLLDFVAAFFASRPRRLADIGEVGGRVRGEDEEREGSSSSSSSSGNGSSGDRLTCFRDVAVGSGCRTMAWSGERWRWSPPFYTDFLGADVKPYVEYAASLSDPERDPPANSQEDGHAEAAADTFASTATKKLSPVGLLFQPMVVANLLVKKLERGCPSLSPSPPPSPLIIFVVRTEKRRITNRAELVQEAAAFGRVVVLRFGDGSFSRPVDGDDGGVATVWLAPGDLVGQARLCAKASVLTGAHGAGLASLVFMPKGSTVVELTGNLHVNVCFNVLSQLMGHNYQRISPDANRVNPRCAQPYSSACKNDDFAVDRLAFGKVIKAALS